jgi:hypothetical protein
VFSVVIRIRVPCFHHKRCDVQGSRPTVKAMNVAVTLGVGRVASIDIT